MENATPMIKQYNKIKSQYKEHILFFRLGDFYEMFYDDAIKASSILNVVLTSRGKGKSASIPMCGIPFHAADNYITKLIKAGCKVAICEQVEDPASSKGIVKRDVVRVITSGNFIDENNNNPRYLLCLNHNKKNIGIAFTDSVTGTITVNEYSDKNKVIDLIAKLPIYECIFPQEQKEIIQKTFLNPVIRTKKIALSEFEQWHFNYDIAQKSLCEHFKTNNLKGFNLENKQTATTAAYALLEYLKQTNKQSMQHVDSIKLHQDEDFVYISPAAFHGLNIDLLFEHINNTKTPFGKRMFYNWTVHPLKKKQDIIIRQDAVKLLKDETNIQSELGNCLKTIPDIEKSLTRLSCGLTKPRDFLSLRSALTNIPEIIKLIKPFQEKNQYFKIDDLTDLRILLEKSINPETPLTKPEGKVINSGYNEKLDELRQIQENGNQWLKDLQQKEIERTKINSLKIGFNKVFGYYIEVSKTNLSLVPDNYIRKQTLVNGERFITEELKNFEEEILTSKDKILSLEKELLDQIRQKILDTSKELHILTDKLSSLDCIYSLSILANKLNYCLPTITEDTTLDIKQGRHIVVQDSIDEQFIPNDSFLNSDTDHLIILTGPNMAGKSTYIRQVALLVILAQIGSFIPAESATIGIVDKIFTRIGAHDEITKGQSTFMVEMSETAGILNNLTDKSLIILDEIGRGTSTYDGLSLAWAIAEYLQKQKCRTLFATHFHELTSLAKEFSGVRNYNVAVKEWQDEVVFLHKIIEGSADDSYGIYVAKLAGINKDVITRARKILTKLELHGALDEKIQKKNEKQLTLNMTTTDKIAQKLKDKLENIDINTITPIEALNKINQLKEIIENE